MKTLLYCHIPQKDNGKRKLKLKLPNYLIRRKISIIREKIIARKYGILYLRKVFGKYFPSECRRYYKKQILKKYFEKLRAHWFEKKEIHRLLCESNDFFKKKLTRRMFNGWQTYAIRAKIVKQQALIVRYKYDEFKMKTILYTWNAMIHCRKKYKLLRSNAIELYYLMYTILLLLNLAEYYSDEIEEKLLEIKSILRGKIYILRKYIRKWKVYRIQQKNYRILRSKATIYYRSKISVIHFSYWQRYVCYKRTKSEIIELCTGLYEDRLLKMAVRIWKNKTTSRIVEKKHMQLASKFYDDLSNRKILKTWRRYVNHKLQGRRLNHKASFFHTMKLKQKVLNVLSNHVTWCKNTRLAVQKLKLFYRRMLIITVWNKWVKLIDEKNDSEFKDNLLLAISFYNKSITKKCLIKWIGYGTTQQRRKVLKLRAADLCKTYYCKKYLNIWKTAYRKKIQVTLLEEKALKFFNDSLMRNGILQWIKSYNDKISMKAKYNKSVLHYERKISSKCFATWINFCNEKIRADNLTNEARVYYLEMIQRKVLNKLTMNVLRMKMKQGKITVAENFHKKNIVIKAFANWRVLCIRVKELKKKVAKFDEKTRYKLKLKIIVQWKLYVHHKKCSHRKTLMSISHRRKKACSIIFKQLKNYVNYKNDKKFRLSYLEYGVEGIQQNLRKIYFQRWRVARLSVLKDKCKMFRAEEFHESHLKQKYFLLWQTFLIKHKIKCQYQSNLINKMNCFVLKRFLRVWYTRYQASLENHCNEKWTSKIYEMKIRYKYFIGWKYFTEICTKERKEINNAKEYHKKLIVKEGLQHLVKLYLCNTELRFETQLKNVERNSSSVFELLKRYFNKWHKAVSTKTKNRSQAIKNQTDLRNIIPINLKTNDRKYISNLIPRFVIPEFMKEEIKLRFGIGECLNKIPTDTKMKEILKWELISKADRSLVNQKLGKNILQSRMDGTGQEKIQFNSKNDIVRSQHSRLNMKMISPSKTSQILSPVSHKSDSNSAKTYIVQNPVYSQNIDKTNSARDLRQLKLSGKHYNKENDYKLLPPAAFYVSLEE